MNRLIPLDIFRIVLAFMVIGIHTGFLSDFSMIANYLTVNGLFRIAVPMFLLISGFYFYSIVEKGRAVDWLTRIIYLYLFWMLFYAYLWFIPSYDLLGMFKAVVSKFLVGYYHLWYLPGVLGAAVLVTMLRKTSQEMMVLAGLITFSIGILIQYIGAYHLVHNDLVNRFLDTSWSHRNFLFLAFPFFLMGYLINKHDFHIRIDLKGAVLFSIIGLLLLVGESYINYTYTSDTATFDNLASLIIVCPFLFILFMNLRSYGDTKQMALYASGIYFVHIAFARYLLENEIMNGGTPLTIVVFISSVIATYFLIKLNNKFRFIL